MHKKNGDTTQNTDELAQNHNKVFSPVESAQAGDEYKVGNYLDQLTQRWSSRHSFNAFSQDKAPPSMSNNPVGDFQS